MRPRITNTFFSHPADVFSIPFVIPYRERSVSEEHMPGIISASEAIVIKNVGVSFKVVEATNEIRGLRTSQRLIGS